MVSGIEARDKKARGAWFWLGLVAMPWVAISSATAQEVPPPPPSYGEHEPRPKQHEPRPQRPESQQPRSPFREPPEESQQQRQQPPHPQQRQPHPQQHQPHPQQPPYPQQRQQPPYPQHPQQQPHPPQQSYPPPQASWGPPGRAPQGGTWHSVPYEEGMPVPPGGYVVESRHTGLWTSALTIFATWYFGTFVAGSVIVSSDDASRASGGLMLMVPAVGPFLFLSEATRSGKAWLIMDGVLQSAGILGFIIGLTHTEEHLIYYGEGPRRRSVTVAPRVGLGSAGVSLAW